MDSTELWSVPEVLQQPTTRNTFGSWSSSRTLGKLGIDFFESQSTTYLLIAEYYSRFPVIRKVRTTVTSATAETLRQVFSEYGFPQIVMTDNGPPFSSKEFAAFANQYRFDHITSSPRYPQSNSFIERMVQTVKQPMRKCAAAGHDPNLAMSIYWATPLTTSIPSPAELLNGRKYRALLPTRSSTQNPHSQVLREQMVKDKDKMCEHYNKIARDLPSLPQNQKVYVQFTSSSPAEPIDSSNCLNTYIHVYWPLPQRAFKRQLQKKHNYTNY